MKLSLVTVALTFAVFASHAAAYRPACAGTCHVTSQWKPAHKCPWYCKTETCYKNYNKGVKCVSTPKPTPSSSPSPSPAPKLPKGCAKICVASPWKWGYKCPYYCKTVTCHKNYKKGIKCVPIPKPTPSASPAPKLPKGCAKVCVATPFKWGYKCPHYCVTESCTKHYKKGIKCIPKPKPVHKPCPGKCMSYTDIKKMGCDENICSIDLCPTTGYRTRYAKCVPRY